MPNSMRPPEIRLSVAKRLAVTVRSRTAGLVTHGPSRMLRVAFAIRVRSGYGSFHSTWESKIHPYSNPASSACRVSATMRSTEISGLRVIPNFMLFLSVHVSLHLFHLSRNARNKAKPQFVA